MVAVVYVSEDGSVLVPWDVLDVADCVPVGLEERTGHVRARLALAEADHAVAVAHDDQGVEGGDLALDGLVRDPAHHERLHGEPCDVGGVQESLAVEALREFSEPAVCALSGGGCRARGVPRVELCGLVHGVPAQDARGALRV